MPSRRYFASTSPSTYSRLCWRAAVLQLEVPAVPPRSTRALSTHTTSAVLRALDCVCTMTWMCVACVYRSCLHACLPMESFELRGGALRGASGAGVLLPSRPCVRGHLWRYSIVRERSTVLDCFFVLSLFIYTNVHAFFVFPALYDA